MTDTTVKLLEICGGCARTDLRPTATGAYRKHVTHKGGPQCSGSEHINTNPEGWSGSWGDLRPLAEVYRGRVIRAAVRATGNSVAIFVNGTYVDTRPAAGLRADSDDVYAALVQGRNMINGADYMRLTDPDARPAFWFENAPAINPTERHAAYARAVTDDLDNGRALCDRCGILLRASGSEGPNVQGTRTVDASGHPVAVCASTCPTGVDYATAYPLGTRTEIPKGYASGKVFTIDEIRDGVDPDTGEFLGRIYWGHLSGYQGRQSFSETQVRPLDSDDIERYAVVRDVVTPVESAPVEATPAPVEAAREFLVIDPAGHDFGRDVDFDMCVSTADELGAGAEIWALDANLCRTVRVYRVGDPDASPVAESDPADVAGAPVAESVPTVADPTGGTARALIGDAPEDAGVSSFTVDRSVLVAVSAYAARWVLRKPLFPVQGGVLVTVGESVALFETSDFATSSRAVVRVSDGTPGRFVINAADLAETVKALPQVKGSDRVRVQVEGSGVTFRAGKVSMTRELLPVLDFLSPAPFGEHVAHVDASALAGVIARVTPTAGKRGTVLSGVSVTEKDGNVIFAATDSRRAVIEPVPNDLAGGAGFLAMIVDRDVLSRIGKTFGVDAGAVTIAQTEGQEFTSTTGARLRRAEWVSFVDNAD